MLSFLITAIKFIILIGFLVVIHEGGHFLVAKLCKVKVNEFSVGFGPKLLGKRKGETLYALRAVPLGGYVMLEGEEQESSDPRAFNNISVWKRILIVSAGGVINIIFGLTIYFIIATGIGVMPENVDDNILNRIYYGAQNTLHFAGSIANNVKDLFTHGIQTDQLMGPIGISTVVSHTSGFVDFVYIMALISLSLGVTNLLPFPPLDGGKIVIYLIEAIRRKKMSMELEVNIQAAGFMLMILLSIYVAYNDILRIF